MQHMLDVCTAYGHAYDIKFNAKKCMFMLVGKRFLPDNNIVLLIDGDVISYVTEFKYLGVSFTAGKVLDIDVSYMKRRFYSACNGILCKCKLAPEPVHLQLVKSYCLPYLTYWSTRAE